VSYSSPGNFWRVKVGGSLVCAHIVTGEEVDTLLGIEDEPIDDDQVHEIDLTTESSINTEVVTGMPDALNSVDGDMMNDEIQPGYLPNAESVPSPFTTKQVQNMLQVVMTIYHSYPKQKQIRESTLIASLQEAVMCDKSTHSKSYTQNGVGLAVRV
jgi:hypothetical protein